jgi:hypothetical protein
VKDAVKCDGDLLDKIGWLRETVTGRLTEFLAAAEPVDLESDDAYTVSDATYDVTCADAANYT